MFRRKIYDLQNPSPTKDMMHRVIRELLRIEATLAHCAKIDTGVLWDNYRENIDDDRFSIIPELVGPMCRGRVYRGQQDFIVVGQTMYILNVVGMFFTTHGNDLTLREALAPLNFDNYRCDDPVTNIISIVGLNMVPHPRVYDLLTAMLDWKMYHVHSSADYVHLPIDPTQLMLELSTSNAILEGYATHLDMTSSDKDTHVAYHMTIAEKYCNYYGLVIRTLLKDFCQFRDILPDLYVLLNVTDSIEETLLQKCFQIIDPTQLAYDFGEVFSEHRKHLKLKTLRTRG